ncbi:leucine-rich repeat domain-containing protein [Romboutsia sp. 13368]|uniref:leucine-rich repeat domain-containing protein n=1 Tax=Romboutsia sp. 13368 TaxID=2708053 RepID=UPI0025EE5F07|nr:leucine-rich repeat domain-containing protein [Romboutsia sp. 13368]
MKYINIPDINLKEAINEALQNNSGERSLHQDITEEEILSITTLYANSREIYNLTGLRYAKNITYLNLPFNNIKDISELKYLTKLEKIVLWHNNIEDLTPIEKLINLKHLEIDDNQIISIEPLKNLTSLVTLWASFNKIRNVEPLRNLINLRYLYLNNNEIKDIDILKNLTNLEYLGLHYNKIENVDMLNNLTKLKILGISKNSINDLSQLSNLSLEDGFFAWDQTITMNISKKDDKAYTLDLSLLKDREDKVINITDLESGTYDKEKNIIKWDKTYLPHTISFKFNNGMLEYENNSFYGSVIVNIEENKS